jgi:NAD(P)-dependent dehydrogenase (short-subunit alcohol dehydrogenase family)
VAKGALVVTGASRGIGAATARLAARSGYAVCVNYLRDTDAAARVAGAIRAEGGIVVTVQADTSSEAEVKRLFAVVDRELGPLAGLVNNAGIPSPRQGILDTRLDELRRVLDVNFIGHFLCAREAVARLAHSRHGRGGAIVNVSSRAAQTGGSRILPYAAAKGAVEAFTRGLAREVAAEGIRVNAVSPGVIATEQHDLSDTVRVEAMKASVPLGRLGTPEEVAEAILWLLSDQASYITGTILPVSGGR